MKLPKVSKELVVAILVAAVIAVVFLVVNPPGDGGGANSPGTAQAKDACDRWNDDAVATMTKAISIRKSETVSEEELNTLSDDLQTMNTSRPQGCESSERLLELHEEYKAQLGL